MRSSALPFGNGSSCACVDAATEICLAFFKSDFLGRSRSSVGSFCIGLVVNDLQEADTVLATEDLWFYAKRSLVSG